MTAVFIVVGLLVFLGIAGVTGGVIFMVMKNNAPRKKKKRPAPERRYAHGIRASD
jgi:hypothetical protein